MPKLPALKPSEVLKALQRIGFTVIRSKGGHMQLKKGNLLVTIPFHSKDLKAETLRSILRQAKINFEELKKNL
uniref:Addiction module toxin, HicA family n=1 Tax=Caldisericum exile TaxID=693075 RepID=A0A7C4TX06_9BACT